MATYRKVGNLLFLSGVGPRQMRTGTLTATFAEQCVDVFDQVSDILDDAGSSWDELVDVTVFLTDIATNLTEFEELWGDAFRTPATEPCQTLVQPAALPVAGAIYLKCIASVR